MDMNWSSKRLYIGGTSNPNYYARITYVGSHDTFISFIIHTIHEELVLDKEPDLWISVRDINNILNIDCRQYVDTNPENDILTIEEMNDEPFILGERLIEILDWLEENHIYFHHVPFALDILKSMIKQVGENIKHIMHHDTWSYSKPASSDCDSCKYKLASNDDDVIIELHGTRINTIFKEKFHIKASGLVVYRIGDKQNGFRINMLDHNILHICVVDLIDNLSKSDYDDFVDWAITPNNCSLLPTNTIYNSTIINTYISLGVVLTWLRNQNLTEKYKALYTTINQLFYNEILVLKGLSMLKPIKWSEIKEVAEEKSVSNELEVKPLTAKEITDIRQMLADYSGQSKPYSEADD